MSQRFLRCQHCGLPHDVMQVACPVTGKPMMRSRGSSSFPKAAVAPPTPAPVIIPTPPPPPLAVLKQRATAAATTRRRALLGATIGNRYKVKQILGEGGMGTVYEAENLALGRAVAIKVLHPAQARKRDAVRRFHQEARAAGAIGHPNICEVYDFGSLDDGSPYLVMEKLVGETLADRIAAEGGLPFEDVIEVLVQVLSGLVAAHEKGVVHRDIKPENIFLTRRVGVPALAKLLDFGVSKMLHPVLSGDREDDLDLTRTGMVMGTPYYMSPEQARGDRNLDARVDLWACGVILYEALTGRRPFQAANYNALLMLILSQDPKPARDLRPALPQGFDAVLAKSMARARDDRYLSAAAFQTDLQALRDRHVSGGHRASPRFTAVAQAQPDARAARPASPAGRLPPGASVRVREPPPGTPVAATAPASPPRAGRRDAPLPRRSPSDETPPMSEEPSSIDIPVTFAADTPLSGEQIPIVDVNKLDSRDRRAILALRRPSSRPPQAEVDNEETAVHAHERGFPPIAPEDAYTTQRNGPEIERAIAEARAEMRREERAIRDTVRDTGPDPRTARQPPSAPPVAPPPPPSNSRAFKSVPPPPKSVPPPPPPPQPRGRVLELDEATEEDDAHTQLYSPPRRPRPASPDDTVKMEGDLEERLRNIQIPAEGPPTRGRQR